MPVLNEIKIDIADKNIKKDRLEDRLEANGILGSVINLAMGARDEHTKAQIYLETEWIGDIAEDQHKAINQLELDMVNIIRDKLRSMGLEQYVVIERVSAEALKEMTLKGRFTIAIGSQKTIDSVKVDETDKPFLAAINTSELEKAFREIDDPTMLLEISLTEMVCLTLELASGKAAPSNAPIIGLYDPGSRKVIFLPRARKVNCQELRSRYDAKKTSLLDEAA